MTDAPPPAPKRPRKAAAAPGPAAVAPRTEGQARLVSVEGSHQDIATRLGTSRQAVHQWRSGEKIPGATMRERVAQVLAIPIDAWDRAPGSPTPVPPVPALIGADEVGELEALIALCAAERAKGSLTAANLRDNIKLESQLREQRTKAIERVELQETRIVTGHPFWKRIRSRLLEALRPYPDAARAVTAALEELRA